MAPLILERAHICGQLLERPGKAAGGSSCGTAEARGSRLAHCSVVRWGSFPPVGFVCGYPFWGWWKGEPKGKRNLSGPDFHTYPTVQLVEEGFGFEIGSGIVGATPRWGSGQGSGATCLSFVLFALCCLVGVHLLCFVISPCWFQRESITPGHMCGFPGNLSNFLNELGGE